ncbi:MAG: T9SS type A sorting domain-containing protein [Bacteroidia bacterium]
MRYIILCLFLSVLISDIQAQDPPVKWDQVRNPRTDQPATAGRLWFTRDMGRSPWGAFYLTGYSGRADTARLLRTYSSNANPGLSVPIYAPVGDTLDFVWGTSLAFSQTDVFVSGLFKGAIEFDENNIFVSQDEGRDAFLASYSPGGFMRWAVSLGDNFEEKLPVIGITEDDRLSLALRTADTLFRPIEIRTFDRLGNKLDSVKINHSPEVDDILFDKKGNLFLAGKINAPSRIGGNLILPNGIEDFYLTKYRADGSMSWLTHAGTGGEAAATAIEVGDDGRLYFAAQFGLNAPAGDTLTLFDSTYYTTRGSDILVGALDTSGQLLWSQHIHRGLGGFSTGMRITDITINDQDVYMAGSFMDGPTIIGDTTIQTSGFDPVVLAFSTKGVFHWATRFGTANDDEGLRIANIRPKEIFVTGVLNNLKDTLDASFGDIVFPVSTKFDPFLATLHDLYIPPVTSIETDIPGDWNLFPNPANDRIYLRWSGTMEPVRKLSLSDVQGRTLFSQKVQPSLAGQEAINLHELAPGFYFLKVQVGSRFWVKSFQKL